MGKRRAKGEGTIFKEKTGLWVAEITLPGGKRKRKRSKHQKVVKEWLLAQREALRQGLIVENDGITLTQLLDKFLEMVSLNLQPKTVDSYKYIVESHIKPEIGHIKLLQLHPEQLQSLYNKKLDEGLSKRTVQYIHSVTRRALNLALKWGYIYRNPTDLVSPPTPKKKAPITLSEGEIVKFLESVKYHRWYPIYVLAVGTGMREGEILGLRWEDVDLENGVISVTNTVYTIRGKTYIGEPKSENSRRTIALPEYALDVLNTLESGSGLIFTTSSGKPVSQRNLLRHFQQNLKKAGLPKVTFHSLRHFHASYLLKSNVHPKIVQERLGHSTIGLTMDTYSHVIPDIQKEAAEKSNGIFKA